MRSLWRFATNSILRQQNFTKIIPSRSIYFCYKNNIHNITLPTEKCPSNMSIITIRNKSKKGKSKYDSDDDEEEDFNDDDSLSKDSKLVKFSTTSMRTDAILKSALGVARNKIELYFYESKIRVNGRKILKKSTSVRPGDEIDVIKMISPKNSNHLYVARVEVLNAAPQEENILVTARRFKNLLIENYENDPFKASSTETE